LERRVIADTSGIIAFLNRDDRYHEAVVEIVKTKNILIPVTVLPEVDYLATKYLGERVARTFLEDITEGNFAYLSIDITDLARTNQIMKRYKGFPLDLVDASLVALAERYQIRQILTLDRRHFSSIQTEKINFLELLP